MKKRFTLMMMVLCFLMSIPLKMMAQDEVVVVSHYKQGNDWKVNTNFVLTKKDGEIYTWVLKDVPKDDANRGIFFRIKIKNGSTETEYGPQSKTLDLKLTSDFQKIYQISWKDPKALKIEATSGTSYTITYNHNTKEIKYDVSEGGSTGSGSEGSGGSTTDDTWAETENRLKGRVYTQGYYLAGNFFSFSGEKVTYDDAVFKFQQQKNDDDGNAIYKVEIPASVTAHAQIMSVNELGKAVKVYGPGSAYGIRRDNPQVSQSVSNTSLVSSTIFDEGTNYWNITSRNETSSEYTDGIYEVFITIDKTTGEPSKCEFKHVATKRVAYFISDAKNATALPVYDSRQGVTNGFSNKFYGTVSFSADHSYYVIAN